MAETYYLKLLGFPELRRPDGRPVKFKVRKHLALLVYLVVDGREIYYRDELADLLWPEVPEENGRHSLSMAFSVIRGVFGSECIGGNHAEVRFKAPAIATDLDQLEQGEVLGGETAPALEVDAFLRDFQIEDAPGFQHWKDRRNAQLLPMLQSAIMVLADQARRSADMPRMLALADRLLALDPLSEEGVRAQMEAFAMQGDRIGALRVFEAWKVKLFEELGAVPSDILEGMAARLRRQTAEPTVTLAPVALCTDGRFVGRTAEYRALFEAWEATTQFNTRHVLITGESGIGKSTLALRFASAAALEGAAVARVQCFELEQRIAFGMIGALITSLLDYPSVRGTAPESLAVLARVIPKVRNRFQHLPVPKPIEREQARLVFVEAAFALLEAITEEQPVVIIVDDYPRSDEASLSVLHMLLRKACNERMMVILTERPPEPDESLQSAQIRKAVSYLPMARVEILPLRERETDELIQALLEGSRSRPGPLERRAIQRTSGGNPLAIELLIKDWKTHGEAALAILLPAMAEVPGSALEAIGYDRLIERIVPSLSPKSRLTIYVAAILGPRLNNLEFFEIAELTPAIAMAALSELVHENILRNTSIGLEFVNDLLRARLYLKIPNPIRVRLHSAVADRLLKDAKTGKELAGLEIAWHCMRSRRIEEAIPHLMAGAKQAIAHGAPDEAARALTSALSYFGRAKRAEVELLLAETYQEMGQWNEALSHLETLGTEDLNPHIEQMKEVLEIESRRQLGHYNTNTLCSVLTGVLERARAPYLPTIRVRAALCVAQAASRIRSPQLVRAAGDSLDDVPLDNLSTRDRGRALVVRALAKYSLRSGSKGLTEIQEAASLLEQESGMDTTFVETQIGLGAIACADGRYADAIHRFEAAFATATRISNVAQAAQAAANLSLSYSRLGEFENSLKWSIAAYSNATEDPPGNYSRIGSAAYTCLAFAELGRRAKAIQSWEAFQKELANAETPWVIQSGNLLKAEIQWLMGEKHAALDTIQNLLTRQMRPLSIGLEGSFVRWVTVLFAATRRPKEALSLAEQSYQHVNRLDTIDQAEVLCSFAYLRKDESTHGLNGVVDQAKSVLSRLPISCSKRLRALGLPLPN